MIKPTILLLHGALGSAVSMDALSHVLSPYYRVWTMNFPGHGGEPFPKAGISLHTLTTSLNLFIEKNIAAPTAIFGYSMGGYIALHAAASGNTNILSIATLATKMQWDTQVAEKENSKLDPKILQQKVPHFVSALEKLHAPANWRMLLAQTSQFLSELGTTNPLHSSVLANIKIPVLFTVGDADKTVSIAETQAAAENTPLGRMQILANTPHAMEKMDMAVIGKSILDLFAS